MRTAIFEGEKPNQSDLLDDPNSYEIEDRSKSEDFGALYYRRIQRFPMLSPGEERELLDRWSKFRDQKAKERVGKAHLRMVPPIARATARRFGFEPFWNALPTAHKRDALVGYQEVVSELVAEGNAGLANALEHYDTKWSVVFYTYARTCVRNAIVRRAKKLRSVVDRPFDKPAPYDLLTDPQKPDPIDFRDYVGSRANPSVSDDPEDDLGDHRRARSTRLRPAPRGPRIVFGDPPRRYSRSLDGAWRAGLMGLESTRQVSDQLSQEESRVIYSRMAGLTLKETASDLGMSVATAWRREKQAVAKLTKVNA